MTKSVDDNVITTDELRQQAWVWLRLFHSGNVKPQDAEQFKYWLAGNPAHAAAFRQAKEQWAVIGPAAAKLIRSNTGQARAPRMPLLRRRAFLGAAVSAAAVTGFAVFHGPDGMWSTPAEWRADFHTKTGEQRVLTLADSVNVTLNTQTSIRRQITDNATTGIDLIAGEAAVDLPGRGHGAAMFSVVAGVGRSQSASGRFEVRYLDGKVCVTCIEGVVQVAHPSGNRELRARQQTVYDGHAMGGVALVEPANVAAWRKGELVFTEVRLADVVEEINRYRPGRVVLMNTSVRNRPVTGSFYIASLDLALEQLQHAFDLDSRSLPGGLVVLS